MRLFLVLLLCYNTSWFCSPPFYSVRTIQLSSVSAAHTPNVKGSKGNYSSQSHFKDICCLKRRRFFVPLA